MLRRPCARIRPHAHPPFRLPGGRRHRRRRPRLCRRPGGQGRHRRVADRRRCQCRPDQERRAAGVRGGEREARSSRASRGLSTTTTAPQPPASTTRRRRRPMPARWSSERGILAAHRAANERRRQGDGADPERGQPRRSSRRASTNPDITDPQFAAQYRPDGKPIYFRTVATDAFQGPYMANYFADVLHVKTVYILDDSGAYGVGSPTRSRRRPKRKASRSSAATGWTRRPQTTPRC